MELSALCRVGAWPGIFWLRGTFSQDWGQHLYRELSTKLQQSGGSQLPLEVRR